MMAARQRAGKWLAILRTPVGAVAGVLALALVVLAVLAPILWSSQANAIDTNAIMQRATTRHVFGTDELGRDIFYRTLVATRLSVELALLSTVIGVTIGMLLGSLPVLVGRFAGRLVSATVNIAVAFPGLLLILFFAVIFGVGGTGAVLALGVASAPFYARLTQTLSASVAGREFVAAARVAGVGRWRLLGRHILPNIGEQLVINAMIGAGNTLLAFAALSFLGLGIQPPSYDWGRLLNGGLDGIYQNPWGAVGPAVTIVLAGLAFNLFGEAAAHVIGGQAGGLAGLGSFWLPRVEPSSAEEPVEDASTTGSRAATGGALLAVENLRVEFPSLGGGTRPVRGVSFTMGEAEAVGIVGESGSGKSLTALAVSALIEEPGRVLADQLEFDGQSMLGKFSAAQRHHLGLHLAMVFQDPMTSLNPVRRVGRQLAEVSSEHEGLGRAAALDKAVQRLAAVRVPSAPRRARQYPHEFSGGMRQRAMIAMGLMGRPQLIIADEPTTALDVTVQRQVLRLLDQVRREEGAAILLISHDITVVEQMCDRILVMYAGRIVEEIQTADLYDSASHPYTRALLAAIPDMDTDRRQPLAVIPGRPPEPDQVPDGCAFAARCPFSDVTCRSEDPPLTAINDGQRVACWHPQEGPLDEGAVPAERTGGRK